MTRLMTVPAAPASLVAMVDQHGGTGVTWQPPLDDGGVPLTSYLIQAAHHMPALSVVRVVPADVLSVSFRLSPGERYRVTVAAANAAGHGPLLGIVIGPT